MSMLLSLIIINYNTRSLLELCLQHVVKQVGVDMEIIVIDNDSSDKSVEMVKKEFPHIRTIANKENLGYAGAANQGVLESKGDYVMIMNPDVMLEPDYMKQCIEVMAHDKKIAAITGKLLRYDVANHQKTNIIDTTGLQAFRNRRIVDRGQGMEDKGQFDEPEEVFGVSGACALYRREALEDMRLEREHTRAFNTLSTLQQSLPEYFDNDFFMYKEDVDVSWRLRLAGWKCWYQSTAVAYHGRGTGVVKDVSHWGVFKSRRGLSFAQKYYAYRNQRFMQVKNEYMRGVWHDIGPLVWKEILIGGYILFRDPRLFKAVGGFLRRLPLALRKRRLIKAKRKASWQEMERWMHDFS